MSEQEKARYEAEQAALRRKFEGKPDIRIDPPKDPEVNPEVYRDVEPLLFRGFLTLAAEINGVYFVFKSLNQHEFALASLMCGLSTRKDPSQQFWDLFLSHGVFMIDGVNVLPERDRWLPKLADTFREFPKPLKDRIVRYIGELNRRSAGAIHLTEAYVTEVYSRYRWAQYHGLDLVSPSVTGISGTEHLGLNWCQLTWRALNYYEDLHQQHEREWENAKFTGACFAGKGVSKVYQQDNDRRQKEKEETLARKDRILRHVLLGEPLEDGVKQEQGGVKIVARTVDELVTQLEHDLKGEQDWHDKVIADHEKRIRNSILERQKRNQELSRLHDEELDSQKMASSGPLQGYRPDEVVRLLQRRKQLDAQRMAARLMPAEPPKDPNTSQIVPLPVYSRTPGVPFKRG